jgi:glutamate/tyrosine decarboxylase-like PLP-dependent enzyme
MTESDSSKPERDAPLALSPDEFRRLGRQLVDQLADCLEAMPHGRVRPAGGRTEIRRALDLDADLPEQGTDAGPLLERATRLLFENSLFNGHPRFMGYLTSSPAPIGMLGELLSAALNSNVRTPVLSPAATEVEEQTVRWLAQFIGYPADAGGILVSGGGMANLVCLHAARVAATGSDVREGGIAASTRRLRVYATHETHVWLQKAVDVLGLGAGAIRWIPTGDGFRMDVSALRDQLAADRDAGDVPIAVVAAAGTVSTGAVDPLGEIAATCRELGVWFHVDGAYGAFAAAVPGAPEDLRMLGEADSLVVDPHKWLYAPIEAGCVLVRDARRLRDAFASDAPYYQSDPATLEYGHLGVQNTRGFRALKIWLALQHVGAAGYRRMIGDDIQLSRDMAAAIERERELELLSQGLSIVTFRFVPPSLRGRDAELDSLNRQILDRVQQGGEAFLSHAVLNGRFVLRACIVNFHTERKDIDAVVETVVRLGREASASEPPSTSA